MDNSQQKFDQDQEYQHKYAMIESWLNEGKIDDYYADYIMTNCADRVCLTNGDNLIEAMESMRFNEEFIEYMVEKELAADADFNAWVKEMEGTLQ